MKFNRSRTVPLSPGRCARRAGRKGSRPQVAARGFTLVELLAALGISLLLIAAVSASLNIYLRTATAGQAATERQQITRALLQQMTRDIASVDFRPAAISGSVGETPPGSTETQTATDPFEETSLEQTASAGPASLGIVGDASSLMLHVSRPQRGLDYAALHAAASPSDRTSDLLSVSYFLASPDGGDLASAVAAAYQANTSTGSVAGLARLEGDRMALDTADQSMDTQLLAAAAQVIAPEIASLQFRYFDGQAWVDSWDSVAMDRLPLAVEVTLGFRDTAAEEQRPTALSSVVPIAHTVRHVFYVPLADPAAVSATGAL